MTTTKDTRAVIEQLVGALEPFANDAKAIHPDWSDERRRVTLTQAKPLTVGDFRNALDALTAGREALATQGEKVQNLCVSELLAFAEMNPGTYIFPGWDGSRVAKYLRLLPTHPQASEPMTDQEYARLTKNGAKAWAGVNAQDLRDGSEPEPCAAGAMCIDC